MRSLTAIANDQGFEHTYTNEFSGNQTGLTIITPTSGKFLQITGVYVATDSTDGKVRVYFSDDENDAINTVYMSYGAESNNYVPLLLRGDRDAVLKLDSTVGSDNYFVLVNYTEV